MFSMFILSIEIIASDKKPLCILQVGKFHLALEKPNIYIYIVVVNDRILKH